MQDFIYEEIRPTRTYVSQSKTMVSAYHVITHTNRVVNTQFNTLETGFNIENILVPGFLQSTPKLPSTSYTTLTITKVSTITSDVTSNIIITLGGRPVQTEYVRPTTMVYIHYSITDQTTELFFQIFTDLHISRTSIIF